MLSLLVGALATWRICRLLMVDNGPFDLLARLRDAVGVEWDVYSQPYGTNMLSKALACLVCLSVWVGCLVAFLLGFTGVGIVLFGLAYSAGAIVIEKVIAWLERP